MLKKPSMLKLPKSIKLPKSLRVPKLPGILKIARIPNVSVLRKVSSIPFLAKIPRRTKLIFAGCILLVCISVSVMLFVASSGGGNDGEDEVVPMQEASKEKKPKTDPVKENPPAEIIEPSENTETQQPVQEQPETPFPEEPIIVGIPKSAPIDELEVVSPIETRVGGLISEDSVWISSDTTYVVADTMRIKSGVKLTIEPGVTITMPSKGDMFFIEGMLQAHGTVDARIVFDGGGNSNFFASPDFASESSVDLDYCRIESGLSLRPQTQLGAFSLKHSEISNLSAQSYLWFPESDVYIENNSFVNTAGFSVLTSMDNDVYVQNNLFIGKYNGISKDADYWIQNMGSYNESKTVVKHNSFSPDDGVALRLCGGYAMSDIVAVENYWGTDYENLINGMIHDKTDDVTCENYINFVPVLLEPHPDTPG